jgi:hypothetical protein
VPWARKFHVLRHTACSIMARQGLREEQTQAILGHGSAEITRAVYTHLFPDDHGMALDLSKGAVAAIQHGNGNGHVEVPDSVPAELVEEANAR